MALEDLTGLTKYINHLVNTNPTSSDPKSEGDNHFQGIKNVLINTFGNITGAITATHTEINKLTGYVGDLVKTYVAQSWTAQQYFSMQTLTDGTTVDWNLETQQVAELTITGSGHTINAPTNMQAGGTYILILKQNGVGGHTVIWDSAYKFPYGAAPAIGVDASDVNVISFVSDGTNMYGTSLNDLS